MLIVDGRIYGKGPADYILELLNDKGLFCHKDSCTIEIRKRMENGY